MLHVSGTISCSQGGSGWIRKTRYRRDAHEESFGGTEVIHMVMWEI